ncbi:MAG: hypothetical protein KAU27_00840, partial [Desulfuromonadales bacterium]|nr:hypothetical protein [Desulfuromonadales bacterium]
RAEKPGLLFSAEFRAMSADENQKLQLIIQHFSCLIAHRSALSTFPVSSLSTQHFFSPAFPAKIPPPYHNDEDKP